MIVNYHKPVMIHFVMCSICLFVVVPSMVIILLKDIFRSPLVNQSKHLEFVPTRREGLYIMYILKNCQKDNIIYGIIVKEMRNIH